MSVKTTRATRFRGGFLDANKGERAVRPWHLEQIGIGRAWEHTCGAEATVAVVDEGVDLHHPEFEGRVVSFDADKTGGNGRHDGWEPHGTKVAGVACAGGGEVIGVAPEALVMPVRLPAIRHEVGREEEAHGILHAADHGADVICCAWGAPREQLGKIDLPAHTRRAVDHAVRDGRNGKGCVVVFAAGNEAASVDDNPYASHPDVVAVGASNDRDRHARYSNTGRALWCVFPSNDPMDPTEIHAEIATTTPTGSFHLGDTWYTDSFGFTSAACAGVAGLCALILSANSEFTWWQVKEVLRDSCVKIDTESGTYNERGHSPLYGYGRPDAGVAVELALARGGIPTGRI